MAYNQGSHSQRYPPDQHHEGYQPTQHENSYNNHANGAYNLNGTSDHRPHPRGAYQRAYPNDGFYPGEIQFEPQGSKEGHPTSGGHSGYSANGQGSGYGGSSIGIGQAVAGDHQHPANPSYVPGMLIYVFYSPGLSFLITNSRIRYSPPAGQLG
jgi:hypothetical protein